MFDATKMEAARNAIEAVEADGFVFMATYNPGDGGGYCLLEPTTPAPEDANGWTSLMHLRARISQDPGLREAVRAFIQAERPWRSA